MDRGGRRRGSDAILHQVLENEKMEENGRAEAEERVNDVVEEIVNHLRTARTSTFAREAERLNIGSYYENLKISNPDEFDVMICVPAGEVNVRPFENTGACYSVSLAQGNNPLRNFQLDESNILSGYKMLQKFRKEVLKSIRGFEGWSVQRKTKGCPAVTLTATRTPIVSLNVVLGLKVNSAWPGQTNKGLPVERWLGARVRRGFYQEPYYLVPKYQGCGTRQEEGIQALDTWQLSFSNIEKAILTNHGNKKTCCEADGKPCCREDCLRLLRHLLHLFKERDPSLGVFSSYLTKTTLLHTCCSRNQDTDWRISQLGRCFEQLVHDFACHLATGVLCNFFIPTQNLLSDIGPKKCTSLADQIREQRDNGFPLLQFSLDVESVEL